MKQVALPLSIMNHSATYRNATLEIFYVKRARNFND